MTNSLLTNTSAMIALQNLRQVNKGLNMVQEQISTGKKSLNRQGQRGDLRDFDGYAVGR